MMPRHVYTLAKEHGKLGIRRQVSVRRFDMQGGRGKQDIYLGDEGD